MWIASRGCPPPYPLSKKPPAAIHALPWGQSQKFMTICACFGRGWVFPYSPATGKPIESQTVSQIVDQILEMGDGTKLYLLAPIVRGRKGEYKKEFRELQAKGFQRVKIDGALYEIDELPPINKKLKHDIEVVVDRLVIREDIATRLAGFCRNRAETCRWLMHCRRRQNG